jgi:hypothetical protein
VFEMYGPGRDGKEMKMTESTYTKKGSSVRACRARVRVRQAPRPDRRRASGAPWGGTPAG